VQTNSLPSPLWNISPLLNRIGITIAAFALLSIMLLVCADVILRQVGAPFKGTEDLVRMFAVVALALALPSTTAAKTHVSIDYLFQKFNAANRRRINTVTQIILVIAFSVAAYQCALRGWDNLQRGLGSPTLKLPIFWVPWTITLGLILSAFASLKHLLEKK